METKKDHHTGRFYGVYLLCSQSTEKRYKGKCYIGYTVNPNRRINQHNRGKDFGGARKTNNKGPWKMVLIVHGFPNNIAALQFEWAWQQPNLSSRLKKFTEIQRKKPKETYFQYNFRILSRMLNVGPWCRLPLILRWLDLEYKQDFEIEFLPPRHMQIVEGEIAITKGKSKEVMPRILWATECHLCMERIENPERSRIGCLNPTCKLTCHIVCLANHMIASDMRNRGHFVPIIGECPLCETDLKWVSLLQQKHRIQNLSESETDDNDDIEEEMKFEETLQFSSSDDEEPLSNNENLDVYVVSD